MGDTLKTPMYSPHPFDPCDPKQVIETAQHQEIGLEASNTYSLLPWTLEDLPGTIWRHVPGGLPMRIDRVGTDEDGRLMPIAAEEIIGPGEFLPELGCWWNDRFCIEYWVRVDHLPPAIQFAWIRTEIAHRRAQAMLVCLDWLARKHVEEEAAVALRLARAFAEQHGLPLSPDLLSVRTFPRPVAPEEATPHESECDVHLVGSDLWHSSYDSLLAQLSTTPGSIALDIACPSVNELDLPAKQKGAQEYLLALYVGETIAECCEEIAACVHHKHVSFVLRPRASEELARKLLWLAPALRGPAGEGGADGAFRRPLKRFASTLGDRVLRFPVLGDKYLEYDMATIRTNLYLGTPVQPNRKHPEQSHGFWRSCVGNALGVTVYMSPLAWILPRHEDLARLLPHFEAFREGIPDLHEAVLLEVKNFFPIVYHPLRAVRCSLDLIMDAQRCVEAIHRAIYHPALRSWEIDLRHPQEISSVVPNTDITNLMLSEKGDLLVATDALAQYIVFKNGLKDVSPEIVRLMLKDVAVLSSLVAED